MEFITNAVSWLNGIVWGVPMLVLILGVGLFLTLGGRHREIETWSRAYPPASAAGLATSNQT